MLTESGLSDASVDTNLKGEWWLPDTPEIKLKGDIDYGPTKGALLSLHGQLHTGLTPFTVWGETVNGKIISLFDCHTKNMTLHFGGSSISVISSYFGVVCGHFKSADEMMFAKVIVQMSYLFEWANTTGINVLFDDSGNGCQVIQKPVPDISLGVVGDCKLALQFLSRIEPNSGNVRLSEKCNFTVETSVLASFGLFEDIVKRFQHFVALGIGHPVYVLSTKARIDIPMEDYEGSDIYEEYEIFHKLSMAEENNRDSIHNMQFSLDDLKPEPSIFIHRFFERYSFIGTVSSLYFSTIYYPEMMLSQRFLTLAFAIEGYHRAVVGGKYQDDDQYHDGLMKTFLESIPENLSSDYRDSLENKLTHLNDFSLRKRVKDICVKFQTILHDFLGDAAEFAGSIAVERNRLTHPASGEVMKTASDLKIQWLKTQQLALLLEVCILYEAGFNEEQLKSFISRSLRAQIIRSRL